MCISYTYKERTKTALIIPECNVSSLARHWGGGGAVVVARKVHGDEVSKSSKQSSVM